MTIALIFAIAAVFIAVERLSPGWKLPHVPYWAARVVIFNACQLLMVFIGAWTWDAVLQRASLFQLGDSLPAWLGGVIAYLVSTFVYYWWHRFRHSSDLLWRVFHQLHHSPQRIEVVTSFYKHPLEIAANGIITSLIVYTLLGLSVEAAAWNTLLSAAAEFFYHWNVRTPRWVGYIIQRPEMHHIHHEKGKHAGNYGDLPIWDILFGTFNNPETFDGECGFETPQEMDLTSMLLCKDIAPKAPVPSASTTYPSDTPLAPAQEGE